MNTLKLRQYKGGTVIKQADHSSEFSYILVDTQGTPIPLEDNMAQVTLRNKKAEEYWETTAQVTDSKVDFTLPGNLPTGDYILEIICNGYVFPSDNSVIISIVEGFEQFDNGEVAELIQTNVPKLIGEAVEDAVKNFDYERLKGDKGDPGEKGEPFTYDDFSEEQLQRLKGDPFTYNDFTPEQLNGLKGDKGDGSKVTDVTTLENGNVQVTFNDSTTVEIPPGKDGYTPQKGVDYFDGKDGVVTIDNLSDEELKRFKDMALPTLEDDLKRATEFDALQGTDDKRIMTPLATKKAIEGMEYDEKINQKTSLEDIETAYSDGMIALAHLSDPGKDLVDKEGKLYRGDVEVGVRVKNAGTTYTIPETVKKARIFFKAQCEEPTFDNYIFWWVGNGTDESKRYVSQLENRTRHYSVVVDL